MTGRNCFPPHGPRGLSALRRLALGDGMLDAALPWLGERFRPAEKQRSRTWTYGA